MSHNAPLQNRQNWLLMVNDPELLNLTRSMQAIWEFDIFELREMFETVDWLIAVKSGSLSVRIPDVALIEWCPESPGLPHQEFLQQFRHIPALSNLPVILLCSSELADTDKQSLQAQFSVNAVISKPLPGLFELNRLIAEARETTQ